VRIEQFDAIGTTVSEEPTGFVIRRLTFLD
jgi:hypothetical protein